ncbi:MAG: hypothetical protein HWD61_15830 [Parachlamydiaceae bacterium]|nr:MAG: hypothetical protein HWD61_15830 [Parachlamydiaceae bacterium]
MQGSKDIHLHPNLLAQLINKESHNFSTNELLFLTKQCGHLISTLNIHGTDQVLLQLLEACPNLRHLSLNCKNFSNSGFEKIKSLEHLEELCLVNHDFRNQPAAVTGDILAHVGQLKI